MNFERMGTADNAMDGKCDIRVSQLDWKGGDGSNVDRWHGREIVVDQQARAQKNLDQ